MSRTTVGLVAILAVTAAACTGSDSESADESVPPHTHAPVKVDVNVRVNGDGDVDVTVNGAETTVVGPGGAEPDLGIDGVPELDTRVLAATTVPFDEEIGGLCGGSTPITDEVLIIKRDGQPLTEEERHIVRDAGLVPVASDPPVTTDPRTTAEPSDRAGPGTVTVGEIIVERFRVPDALVYSDDPERPYGRPDRIRVAIAAIEQLVPGLTVTPNPIVRLNQAFRFSPAGLPSSTRAVVQGEWAESGVRPVIVFDSPMPVVDETTMSLNPVHFSHTGTPEEYELVPQSSPPLILGNAGHGPFIASLIDRLHRGGTGEPAVELYAIDSFRVDPVLEASQFDMLLTLAMALPSVREQQPVVNLSWGGVGCQEAPFEALRLILEFYSNVGATVIAAAGNDGMVFDRAPADGLAVLDSNDAARTGNVEVPAAFDFVTSVGSLDRYGCRSSFSNSGRGVDRWVIGEHIVSQYPNVDGVDTRWAQWSGTSFAAAVYAAGVAAGVDRSIERRSDDHPACVN